MRPAMRGSRMLVRQRSVENVTFAHVTMPNRARHILSYASMQT